jgi:hypothetical protein
MTKRAFTEAVSPEGSPRQGRVDLLEMGQSLEHPQHDG